MFGTKRLLAQILSFLRANAADNKEIKKCLAPSTIDKASKYDEQSSFLADVRLQVKSITPIQMAKGVQIKVVYEAPAETIFLDDDGTVQTSSAFKAINKLNLISVSDMVSIKEQIDKLKIK